MDSLLRMQEDIYKKINRNYIIFKKSPKERISQSYIETRMESLDKIWSTFESNHQKLVCNSVKKEFDDSDYNLKDFYGQTEELFTDYKTELKEKLIKLKSTHIETQILDSSSNQIPGNVKLPRISIPIFSGKYSEWTTFRDLFLSLIHQNKTLQDVQKLRYLKSYLTGEAEQLLRHLPITNENYVICLKLLTDRFNNKKYITNCILKRFFSQKTVINESSNALKELFDTTNECLNALKNEGLNIDNWDIIIIYVLSLKLDNESRKQWEAKICSLTNELPTLKQFLEFLEHRFRSLEFLSPKIVRSTQSHHVVTNTNKNKLSLCSFCSDVNHKLGNCKTFAKEDLSTRRNFVQSSSLCFNCLGANHSVSSCRLPTRCRICKRKHHSLLHSNNAKVSTDNIGTNSQSVDTNNIVATTTTYQGETENFITCLTESQGQVLLATALVNAETNAGSIMPLRSLLDQGSQASFITESAVQLLGLKKTENVSVISGVGSNGDTLLKSKYVVDIKLQSIHDPTFIIIVRAHVLDKLTSFLPERKFVVHLWSKLPKMKLADPKFNIPSKIDLLLGAEVYCQIVTEGLVRGPKGTPMAQNTKFGWILSGKIPDENKSHLTSNSQTTMHVCLNQHTETNNEEFNLKSFWELESDNFSLAKKQFTVEEQRCEDVYKETTTRDSSGRYIVKLPFKNDDPICKYGNSQEIARKRFLILEKRLLKSPQLKIQYGEVISEYIKLNHMEIIPPEEINIPGSLYLPHHAVVRDDKLTTKLRVVFDASCKDKNGVSLNSELMVGPTLQSDLRHILMRWRLHPICIAADIVKMYRQIKVAKEDTNYQRLVWRNKPGEDLQHLRLLRVTFGTASAPYLAVRTLHQVASDEGKQFPLAFNKILEDFYMDDLLTGCQTISEGKEICTQIKNILSKGGFEIQKWLSNNEQLFHQISNEDKAMDTNLELKIDSIVKILGLTWNRRTDEFVYSVQLPPISEPVTKRKVISDIARLFDPIGWISPAIIKAKILIQKLWLTGIAWDEELPPSLLNVWLTYRNELNELTKFRLPRWIGMKENFTFELHGFSDASSEAYAAVVYARVIDSSGSIQVSLITSKTKVAPIKQVSIPRLELCGAVLVAKLLQEVSEILKVPKEKLHAWTDSTVVLAWLSSHPSRWKTFIANRVSEILGILDRNQWSHVLSADNPADCASRGVSPSSLKSIQLWKQGPSWLRNGTIYFDKSTIIDDTTLEERGKKVCLVAEQNEFCLWNKFSSLRKLLRVLAYCIRFISKVRKQKKITTEFPDWITNTEISEALHICIKACQDIYFHQEKKNIKDQGTVNKKSKLNSLNPFFDEMGILRVGGRLEKANISSDAKHPIILPSKSHLTNLLIAEAHEKTLHGGPQLMVNYLRSKYWIIDAKNRVKLYVRKCVVCVRHIAKTRDQLMGQLPSARVTPVRPFNQSGVDYAGPIQIRTTKGRGHRSYKFCLFVCMVTRAIHLEAVSDLTAQGFISAFKRFVARRGHCADLFSDNGTNFVGASRDLKTLFAQERSTLMSEVADCLTINGTTWHFIPPHAPQFGGLWEAGIKSTKYHLKRVIGNATLTFEEMSTLLYQIEACLNSRPLSQISPNPEDPIPLTPGHFLIGEPLLLVPERNYERSNISSLKRWQLTQRMLQVFWRRWSQEYLTQFLHRYKWTTRFPEPKIGDVVLVKEDNLPPGRWLLGIITKKHTGSDNITRVVSLKCKGVIIKRPVNKLCVLPLAE